MFDRNLSRRRLGALLAGSLVATVAAPALAQEVIATPVPVTGSDAFAILHNDHKRIKGLLDRLVAGQGSRKDTILELGTIFTVHNATEENFVYPAIAGIAKLPEDAMELFHQQDEAKMIVWGLSQALALGEGGSPEFTAHATKLRTAALAHVAQEESEDFPALRSALGQSGVRKLTDDVRAFRQRFS